MQTAKLSTAPPRNAESANLPHAGQFWRLERSSVTLRRCGPPPVPSQLDNYFTSSTRVQKREHVSSTTYSEVKNLALQPERSRKERSRSVSYLGRVKMPALLYVLRERPEASLISSFKSRQHTLNLNYQRMITAVGFRKRMPAIAVVKLSRGSVKYLQKRMTLQHTDHHTALFVMHTKSSPKAAINHRQRKNIIISVSFLSVHSLLWLPLLLLSSCRSAAERRARYPRSPSLSRAPLHKNS